ncbi:MAG TPA: DegV family protein [Anaerolineaceae bacterium]|nr:DegV family protein [Anaerolineaceae bacterium]
MINILTDSCSDLTRELIELNQIDVIRLPVFINNQTYYDGLDIEPLQLFSLVEKTGQLPKTSAPSVAELIKFFDRPGETIFIGIGSPLSATYSNALIARQTLENKAIRVIDSLNLSTGIGLLVLKAGDLRKKGLSAEKIEQEIRDAIPKVHTSFVLDTLEYVYKGGRCSSIQMIVGSLLKIRPILEVRKDGTLGIREKIRGSRKSALDSMLLDFKNHLPDLDPCRVFVTHTACEEDAQYLAEELTRLAPIENLYVTLAGSTISSHAGPRCIGILYSTK